MLLGFVGLGAVVETAYLPALRNMFGEHYAVWDLMFNPQSSPQT